MSYIKQVVVGPARTYRQKMRCCYPKQNRAMHSQGPIEWIVAGGDHDTRLQRGKLEPLSIVSWKCLEGLQIPVLLSSSPTVHRVSVFLRMKRLKRAI